MTLSVGLSEPTNNQSLEIRNAMETNTTVVKVRNTLGNTLGQNPARPLKLRCAARRALTFF